MQHKIMMGVVVGVVVAAFVLGTQCTAPAPSSSVADSLRAVNGMLAHQNNKLKAENAQLVVARDSVEQERDSIKAASDSATARLQQDRPKLPPAATVPDTALRQAYAEGLRQLDAALAELVRKDIIIRKDSIAAADSRKIEINLREQVATVEEQYRNEQSISAEWKRKFEEASKPKCGKKCGMIIGVLSTVGVAIAANKVQDLIEKKDD